MTFIVIKLFKLCIVMIILKKILFRSRSSGKVLYSVCPCAPGGWCRWADILKIGCRKNVPHICGLCKNRARGVKWEFQVEMQEDDRAGRSPDSSLTFPRLRRKLKNFRNKLFRIAQWVNLSLNESYMAVKGWRWKWTTFVIHAMFIFSIVTILCSESLLSLQGGLDFQR